MNRRDLCALCVKPGEDLEKALYDVAHIPQKDVKTLLNLSAHQSGSFFEKVRDIAARRKHEYQRASRDDRESLARMRDELFGDILDILEDGGGVQGIVDSYLADDSRHALEERVAHEGMSHGYVEEKDIIEALKIFVNARLIDVYGSNYRLTPRGCRRLAAHILKKILENVSPGMSGIHESGEEGFGTSEGFITRRYEYGDEFSRIDTQATLIAAFERSGGKFPIPFTQNDIRIRETLTVSRAVNGVMVDASGSMAGDKLNAAMEACLALSELVRRSSRDILKIYIFSRNVEEIPYWEIPNRRFSGTITDIRGALRKFRNDTRSFRGDKQAYLITDMSPNTENGEFIGRMNAVTGIVEEARICRANDITINIIMLDKTKQLKDLASGLARANEGRAFFTQPGELGKVIIEDYLRRKRK